MSFPSQVSSANCLPDSRFYIQRDSLVASDSAASMFKIPCHPARPQAHNYIRSLQHVDQSNSEPRKYFEQFVEAILLERSVNLIRGKLSAIPVEAEAFLRNNLNITLNSVRTLEEIEGFLRNSDVQYTIFGDLWQDSEVPDFQAFEILVKIDVSDFRDILKLWKAVDARIYQTLGRIAKEKIIVMFERL